MPTTLTNVLGWAGLGLLSLVFLANALGIIDQSTARRELAASGVPEPIARLGVAAGRILQLVASPVLFFSPTRPYAAVALAAFLVPATLTAHPFWRADAESRAMQIAGFLKNTAIIGGLVLAAAWRNSS